MKSELPRRHWSKFTTVFRLAFTEDSGHLEIGVKGFTMKLWRSLLPNFDRYSAKFCAETI